MLSTRFAGATILLVSAALVPTTIHTYLEAKPAQTRKLNDLQVLVDGDRGTPTNRTNDWAVRRFATADWLQRSYYDGTVTLTVVRSFDPKRLYHHPELAVAYPDDYEAATVVRFPQRPEVPIRVMTGRGESRDKQSMYALSYKGSYVEDPIRFQLLASLELLFRPSQPMTLVFAREATLGGHNTPPAQSRCGRVLLAAIESVAAQ